MKRTDGGVAYRLSADGARVARQLAMTSEDAQDALLGGLLDASELIPDRATLPL
jgi:hypothetical protein